MKKASLGFRNTSGISHDMLKSLCCFLVDVGWRECSAMGLMLRSRRWEMGGVEEGGIVGRRR